MKGFEIAAGTIVGRDHVMVGKNNQDAFCWMNSRDMIIAIVCDGCGSASHSEVGAKVGAKLILEAIKKQVLIYRSSGSTSHIAENSFWDEIAKDVLAELRILANTMSESISLVSRDYFLFTVVGAVITPLFSLTFSFGDGVLAINGDVTTIGPFPNNAPPYLAYSGLLDMSFKKDCPELLKFQMHKLLLTEEVQSIFIGTDGVGDFIENQFSKIPGKDEPVGPISQFWEDDRYFKNPDMIRRRLFLVSRDYQKIDWEEQKIIKEPGLLSDDTTLIVIRRKDQGGEEVGGLS